MKQKPTFNWQARASELFDVGLDFGKQYVSGRLDKKTKAAQQKTMAQAAQTDAAVMQTQAKTLITVAAGGVLLLLLWQGLRKGMV